MANILPGNLGENILNLLMGIDAELVHKDSDSHIRIKKDDYSTTISFDDNLQTNTKGHLTLHRPLTEEEKKTKAANEYLETVNKLQEKANSNKLLKILEIYRTNGDGPELEEAINGLTEEEARTLLELIKEVQQVE